MTMSVKEDHAKPMLDEVAYWRSVLGQFCHFERGELFQMNDDEVPMLYIMGAAKEKEFRSMNVLERFN